MKSLLANLEADEALNVGEIALSSFISCAANIAMDKVSDGGLDGSGLIHELNIARFGQEVKGVNRTSAVRVTVPYSKPYSSS